MPRKSIPPATQLTGCIHHWKIETPAGPTCHGFCCKCGEERDFPTAPLPDWFFALDSIRPGRLSGTQIA